MDSPNLLSQTPRTFPKARLSLCRSHTLPSTLFLPFGPFPPSRPLYFFSSTIVYANSNPALLTAVVGTLGRVTRPEPTGSGGNGKIKHLQGAERLKRQTRTSRTQLARGALPLGNAGTRGRKRASEKATAESPSTKRKKIIFQPGWNIARRIHFFFPPSLSRARAFFSLHRAHLPGGT